MNRWRRTPLGTRLALALGALALVVFAVVGTVLVTTTQDYLARRLDEQMAKSQKDQTSDITKYNKPLKAPYSWYSVVYAVANGKATALPGGTAPADPQELVHAAQAVQERTELFRTVSLDDRSYRVRACPIGPGQVLVSAAPFEDLDSTVRWLLVISVGTFAAALLALVVFGRMVLRKGLRPLSEMAGTAHDIATRDLTDSAHLPTRAVGSGGGPEVEELRTALNVMLDHIDSSLAARTAAEQRLRRFVADASHELRTPLTSIRGYTDLFSYAAAHEPAERDAHLAKIRLETSRMSVLVDDLLLLARLDSEAPLRWEDTDLAEVATASADAFQAAHPGYPVTVSVPGPVVVRADSMRVRQVVDNLLANVARHTPSGTVVTVSVSSPGTVAVTDTGPGIPAEHQARIFDRFYRADDSRTRGGAGLGLAVAHSIVSAHGGTLTLTSTPGTTTFKLTLPTPQLDASST